jgi:hypothetical protein
LDRFKVDIPVADDALIQCLPTGSFQPIALNGMLGKPRMRRLKEKPFGFHERYRIQRGNRYLVGYWQSEKYFREIRQELLQQYTIRHPLSGQSRRIAEQMDACNSVALHVRRGDYLSNPNAAQLYEHLELDYYIRAVERFAANRSNVRVFVFSNDIEWCCENLNLRCQVHYVDHNGPDRAEEDLVLMSRAACCVIANSTFSWWAAWLNHRQGKVVYAPDRWFRPGTLDGSDIIPAEWQIVTTHQLQVAS